MYDWITLLYSRNLHIVNQLYFNKNKLKNYKYSTFLSSLSYSSELSKLRVVKTPTCRHNQKCEWPEDPPHPSTGGLHLGGGGLVGDPAPKHRESDTNSEWLVKELILEVQLALE